MGWAQSIMLGFVSQPNLRNSSIYAVIVLEGETQQILLKDLKKDRLN